MTTPITPPINWDEWCCADSVVGGCPHRYVDDHDRDTGHCLAVGCPCPQPRNHTPTCVHTVMEAANDPA
jgi:hypothetical protein